MSATWGVHFQESANGSPCNVVRVEWVRETGAGFCQAVGRSGDRSVSFQKCLEEGLFCLPSCRPSGYTLCEQGEGLSAGIYVTLNLDSGLACVTVFPCFSNPRLNLPHINLSAPNLPVAMCFWVGGLGWTYIFESLSACVCGASGTRMALDLPQLPREWPSY